MYQVNHFSWWKEELPSIEEIHQKCCYRYWFCGHYHNNINLNEKDKVIYKK